MKAIICSQWCEPEDLVLGDLPDPVAGPGEVVIAIKAAALNFFDILMIQGKYQTKPTFPFSPAAEISGVVFAISATAVPFGDCSTRRTSSGKVCRIATSMLTRLTSTPTGTPTPTSAETATPTPDGRRRGIYLPFAWKPRPPRR